MRMRTMTDDRKFGTLAGLMAGLVVLALAYNLLLGPLVLGAGQYIARRWHYERVIVPKGLTLHEGAYWREKK